MSAREQILERLRSALHDNPPVPHIPRHYREHSGLDREERIQLLVDRLVDYKAGVTVVDEAGLAPRIAELLAGAHSYVVPEGLDGGWLADAEAAAPGRRRVDTLEEPLSVAELDAVDAVVTASAVAVAETGTIILDGSPDQGRRAISLVPDHHICVVRSDHIAGILPEALRRLDGTRPLTWISGPSATSDIELERVEGVHGPRNLDVIILRS
ncbi:LUD domain-containing protein [Arthrobacter jiangjiafuii]|uniref:LUD domain-containing protein n=1 Tax=Arthrobacter jiangjiafuii TaxID=2817475 RepID=A0A975R0C5_9MICC|nr:LUD domain-containing protein [Arthrobacter jiangjiafuii]MBP3043765.1 LUD domain-containing protein [Arthrobacter jiangjiafuii]QWC10790.1 LUD domain-containing protein [Arthrobacter jiangjiafuii]